MPLVGPNGGGRNPIARLVPEPAARAAMKQVEDAAGGRDQLFEALLVAPRMGPKQRHLLSLLADPLQKRKSLALLLEEADLTPAGLLQFIRDAKMSRAVVAAMDEVARQLPQVAAETMRRAVPHEVPCDDCDGHGTRIVELLDEDGNPTGQEQEKSCRRCRGKGTRVAQPKTDAQRTALEVGGVLQRGPAIQIGMQQNLGAPSASPDSDPVRTSTAFRTATDRILYPSRSAPPPDGASASEEPVDAEYVEKPQEG